MNEKRKTRMLTAHFDFANHTAHFVFLGQEGGFPQLRQALIKL